MTTVDDTAPQGASLLSLQAKVVSNIKKARNDFGVFIRYIWANEDSFELADFHYDAIKIITDTKHRFVYWTAPRGHAKTLIAGAFAVWCLGRDRNHRIKIVCANDKEARKRLFGIKQQIKRNVLLHACFPCFKGCDKAKDVEWNKSRITISRDIKSNDPSIEALGIMSGALGSRATLIILDDICDLRSSILQPMLRDQVIQKLFGELLPLLEAEGRAVGIGTPWAHDSDANALMSEKFYHIGPHSVGTETDIFAPIWPYKFTRETLQQIYDVLGPAEYARAYQCKALTGDTVPIQARWIKYYDANILGDPHELFCLQGYDLAIEQGKTNDYFAWGSVLWDQKRNYLFVADAGRGRLSFREQASKVIANAAAWYPQEVVIEKGAYQGALGSYLAEDTKIALPIYMFSPRGRSKGRRFTEVSPMFERGRVFFHPKFNPKKKLDQIDFVPIVEELTSVPFSKFDDLADMLTMIILTVLEMSPDLVQEQESQDNKDRDRNMELGTNMSMRLTVL